MKKYKKSIESSTDIIPDRWKILFCYHKNKASFFRNLADEMEMSPVESMNPYYYTHDIEEESVKEDQEVCS